MSFSLRHITNSPLVRNSAKLLSANVMAQVIGLAIYPLLTRLYAPDDFGALNVFLSTGGIITLLSTAELQYAIVLPKDDDKAWHLLQCALVVLVVATLATLWKPLLALYVLVTGLWTLLNYWYTRQQQFGAISRYQIGQSVTSAALKSGMGYVPVSGGLIWGSVLAPLLSLVSNWLYAGRKCIGDRWKTPWKKEEMITALREYKNFPCYNLPRSLVNNLGCNLPALMMAPVFGLTELGFFGMAITLAFRPINMIAASIYQVLYQKFADCYNHKQSIRPIFNGYLRGATIVALLMILALFGILPLLCAWLLGAQWQITGEYIRWMLPWIGITLLVGPVCSLCEVFGKQKLGLIFELLLFVCSIGGICIGIWLRNIQYSIIGYSIGSFIAILIQLVWYISLVKQYEKDIEDATH